MMVIIKSKTSGIATKFAQMTHDKHTIETTYVNYHNKHIICYSTQIGCTNNCKFCWTGMHNKYIRDLTADEIFYQIKNVVDKLGLESIDNRPMLFSAMGVGEPLNNYDDYFGSVLVLRHQYPTCKFALSTSGSNIEAIDTLALCTKNAGITLKLQISIHSARDELRKYLMPKTAPLDTLMNAAERFRFISGNEVEYNITLMDKVNDQDSDAEDMVRLMNRDRYAQIKINRYNQIPGCSLYPAKYERINSYLEILRNAGLQVEYYETDGADIDAACGQMSVS